ncbi:hypothetical protein [Priestia aryabhattai]
MSRYQKDTNRIKDIEELLKDPLLAQIPSDPQPAEIAEILAKNPTVIGWIGNILAELDLKISNKKLLISKKNRELDLKKSEIRLGTINAYRTKLDKSLTNEVDEIKKLMETGYTRTEAKEIVRLRRPEKPREADLSDKAEYLTREFVKDEIEPLEDQIVLLQKEYDDWKVKYKLFENNFKASQSIKGLIQNDRDKY